MNWVQDVLDTNWEAVVNQEYDYYKEIKQYEVTSRNLELIENEETSVEARPKPIRTVVNNLIKDNSNLVKNSANLRKKSINQLGKLNLHYEEKELANTIRWWIRDFKLENAATHDGSSLHKSKLFCKFWSFVTESTRKYLTQDMSSKFIKLNKNSSLVDRWKTPPTQIELPYNGESDFDLNEPECDHTNPEGFFSSYLENSFKESSGSVHSGSKQEQYMFT